MRKIDLSLAAIEKDLRTPYVKTEKDILRELGYTLKFLGGGIFRNVYKIVGTKLVLKVPNGARGRRHSQGEMKAYKRIMVSTKKYVALHPYMPAIHHYNSRTGIILMPEYRVAPKSYWEKKIKAMGKLAGDVMGKYCDLHRWNIGRDKEGQFRFIDLGYFSHKVPAPKRKAKK